MIVVPRSFTEWIVQANGEVGAVWLETLPGRFDELLSRWNLTPDGVPRHGGKALVLPVRSARGPAALKVSWVSEFTREEEDALRFWNGRSVVRVLRSDPSWGALLLERLDGDRTMAELPNDEAAQVAGELIRGAAIPALQGLTTVADQVLQLRTKLEGFWEQLGRPYPRRLLDHVLALADQLPASTELRMVNNDLWDGNVLRSTRSGGGWLAIDPWPLAGDPEFGCAQLLWRRVDRMRSMADLDRYLDILTEAGGLDLALTRDWSFVRIADYWLWALGHGLTEDPIRCQRLLRWMAQVE